MTTPTPFTNVSGDPNLVAEGSDDSQLRVQVKCAFGMFVLRWGSLWMAMPCNFSLTMSVAMVIVLAKLHNFCINNTDEPE